ncbi:tRNA (adenosine(37)-N6)-threonylcarbamoyltransferase complex dimerization subunit type 1 TsaB [Candidatus Saccharibacteria bacterium]|nr:tRNA (adenosine(37)-N6)-threonylcarbamoyltransferase complex dimerization subunit type 1 TsaB [Candidatus Saccharibacteria bacterium]
MIILLDTSTSECRLGIVGNESSVVWHTWQANRELAKGLLAYINDTLQEQSSSISDISGIGVFKGPGSFTGLRIGLTVANTLADGLAIPIVGTSSDEWAEKALKQLQDGKNEKIILPDYGSEAHITKPRK